jgi:hypothetical protein
MHTFCGSMSSLGAVTLGSDIDHSYRQDTGRPWTAR